jgi:hypothetical protein
VSTAILDARGWQNTLDLRTGEKIEATGPIVEMTREVLRGHPYPGDLDPGSNGWVTDTALDLVRRYDPSLVFLTYASQYFSRRYTAISDETWMGMVSAVFEEAQRFATNSGFDVVVLGTGGMAPLRGFIDVTRLDGLAVSTHWSTRYAGLYGPSARDMQMLNEHPQVERIVARKAVLDLFDGVAEQAEKLPEYLMVAHNGYAFKTISDAKRTPVMITGFNHNVPLHAPGHTIDTITAIRAALEENLRKTRTAFIMMEGTGIDDFPWSYSPCSNGIGWYFYEPGEAQYLTALSGTHRFLDYPTGSGRKYLNDSPEPSREYPFSGHFKSIPEGTIGSTFSGRSVAAGNKSMFMHMATGADISIECFARNLYNQGTMAVIHRDNKT